MGFHIVYADDLEEFDPDIFIRGRASRAIDTLSEEKIRPTLSAEELHKLTRGE